MYGYFALVIQDSIGGRWAAESLTYAAIGFLVVCAIAATRFWSRSADLPSPALQTEGFGSQRLPYLTEPRFCHLDFSYKNMMRGANYGSVPMPGTPEGLRTAVMNSRDTGPGSSDAVRFPKLNFPPAATPVRPMDEIDEDELPEQVSIVHQGVLTINFVQLADTPKDSPNGSIPGPGVGFERAARSGKAGDDADSGMILLQHTAVMSTQFNDVRHVVSTSEVASGPMPAAPDEPQRQAERLERIEADCLRTGSYASAAAALSARITLVRSQYGSEHSELVPLYLRLADLYMVLDKPEDAEQCQLRALDIRSREAGRRPEADAPIEDVEEIPLTNSEIDLFSESMMGLSGHLSSSPRVSLDQDQNADPTGYGEASRAAGAD